MCVDYIDLKRACPKEAFPLPIVDKVVDNSPGIMNPYSGYNQNPMYPPNQEKTSFMTHKGNYYYQVTSFGLKNAGETYERMMNKAFRSQIGVMVEVYMDEMIVITKSYVDHNADLT